MIAQLSISVLLVANNARNTIAAAVKGASTELARLTNDFEIIVINDGSRDGTEDVLRLLEGQVPHVAALHLVHYRIDPRGPKIAIGRGLEKATKEFVLFADADGQYDMHDLPRFLRQLSPGIDVLHGYRIEYGLRGCSKWLGEAYRRGTQWIFNLPLRDVQCNFRLIRRSALGAVSFPKLSSDAFWVDLMRKMHVWGFSMIEVPVTYLPKRSPSHPVSNTLESLSEITKLCRLWWHPVGLPPGNNAGQVSTL